MKKLDEFIHLFTTPEWRHWPHMELPVLDGNDVVATNACMAIVANQIHFAKAYQPITDAFPNYKKVIPEHTKENVLFEIDSEFLLDECLVLNHTEEYTDCDVCEGDGNMYTKSGTQTVCNDCGGTGKQDYLGTIIRGPEQDDEYGETSYLFNISGVYFNCNYIEAIARVAVALEQPVRFANLNKTSASTVYIGDVLIVVMPIVYEKMIVEGFKGACTIIEIPTRA